ncbi:MAG TPA: L,D-transpeptidase family protein [Chloroflexota bacterium]|nr:L,D-transpeptidase family protein [Chloroflexota bacterium]
MQVRPVASIVAALVAIAAAMLLSDPAEASKPWKGHIIAEHANIRSAPVASAPIVRVLEQDEQITVTGWVTSQEVEPYNDTWAMLDDGEYVYSALIQKNAPSGPPAIPDGAPISGKWVDVNVTEQVMTAYEGSEPIRVMVVSTGRPEYPTPQGVLPILSRVYNASMTSANLPWVRDYYNLQNVLFTQYFNQYGAALHLAGWKTPESFGIPTSHGCVGMRYQDAEWMWNWTQVGVPIYVHR